MPNKTTRFLELSNKLDDLHRLYRVKRTRGNLRALRAATNELLSLMLDGKL